jgi:hypothetical protein
MDDRGLQINPTGLAHDELSFPCDAVMPAQFYPARRRSTSVGPILRLMAGVLIDAVRSCERNFEARETKRSAEFREADFWIFHDKGDGPFSFENVCAALEIDPRRLRELIVRWEKDRRSPVTSGVTRAPRSRAAGLIQSQHGRILFSPERHMTDGSVPSVSRSSAHCPHTGRNPTATIHPRQQRDSGKRSKSNVNASH